MAEVYSGGDEVGLNILLAVVSEVLLADNIHIIWLATLEHEGTGECA